MNLKRLYFNHFFSTSPQLFLILRMTSQKVEYAWEIRMERWKQLTLEDLGLVGSSFSTLSAAGIGLWGLERNKPQYQPKAYR